ncbi:hypothetical protein [Mucilaginibacter polytrichastri]|uniref:Uncharacterized protein n=1 Tax=Mucilaginibacter polytrichastri TaxID=1302689 RepID=A0A1Q6A3T8_9SPHI|nr:hypothetical protein [Mucilaginibacter polytrichastri]OKS88668.1 hypothetical protein RG47T_4140 [Mucilaginibacter polytrichastri]
MRSYSTGLSHGGRYPLLSGLTGSGMLYNKKNYKNRKAFAG